MTTATTAMMLDAEGQRIERRDRALAMSIGHEMTERFFDSSRIEDATDAREQIARAAAHAAYEAIQRERHLHAADMEVLRRWCAARSMESHVRATLAQVLVNNANMSDVTPNTPADGAENANS